MKKCIGCIYENWMKRLMNNFCNERDLSIPHPCLYCERMFDIKIEVLGDFYIDKKITKKKSPTITEWYFICDCDNKFEETKMLGISLKEINKLIQKRHILRRKKNFPKADKIRKRLEEKGVVLEDNKDGTYWRKKL